MEIGRPRQIYGAGAAIQASGTKSLAFQDILSLFATSIARTLLAATIMVYVWAMDYANATKDGAARRATTTYAMVTEDSPPTN